MTINMTENTHLAGKRHPFVAHQVRMRLWPANCCYQETVGLEAWSTFKLARSIDSRCEPIMLTIRWQPSQQHVHET